MVVEVLMMVVAAIGLRCPALTQIGRKTLPLGGFAFVSIICFLFGNRGESWPNREKWSQNFFFTLYYLTLDCDLRRIIVLC